MSELEVKEKKSKVKVIIAIAVILILGISGYFFYNWNNNKKAQTMFQDPSLRSVMSIQRLSRNPDTAITKDQAVKMLPIVKEMKANQKDTKITQEKAKEITALLNDKQKAAIKNRRPPGSANSNGTNNGSGTGNRPNGGNGNWSGQRGYRNGQRGNSGFGGAGMANGRVSLYQIYDQLIKVLEDTATH